MVSIIIPVFNAHELTKNCLASIQANTNYHETILVDNGSTPAYRQEDINQKVTIVRNESNLGFPVAINQGIRAATGDVIIIQNNDTICTQGWASKLLAHLDTYSIVGPLTNYCAGIQQVTIPVYQDEKELNIQAAELANTHAGESQEANWIIGFCMAFRKSLWEEVGGFDESMWPCCGEEVDFCMKAKLAGHKIGIAQDTYIHHFGSQTFNELEKTGVLNYQKTCFKNDRYLESRWGKDVFVQEIKSPIDTTAVKLNLGCGLKRSHVAGFTNIDNRSECEPDLLCDILGGLPYLDNSVDMILANDFLEHVPNGKQIDVITEIWRVLKHNGILEALTPSTDGRGSFQDPTHVSFWNKNSFLYYSDKECRDLYGIKANFNLVENEDITTNAEWKIIHTHVIAKAIKEA